MNMYKVTWRHLHALKILERGPLPVDVIAAKMESGHHTVAAALVRMVALGMITRRPVETGRVGAVPFVYEIAPEGREVLHTARKTLRGGR